MGGVCDIHCHILPGLDDGASDMVMTERMLTRAYESGIRTIVATPHFGKGFGYASPEQIYALVEQVQQAAGSIHPSMQVLPGEELMFQFRLLEQMDRGEIVSLAGSHYVLVEFFPGLDFVAVRTAIQEITARGYWPIIAHVERYPCFYGKVHLVKQLIAAGAYIQVNSSSFQQKWLRRDIHFVRRLMDEGLIDFVATDGHDMHGRIPVLDDFTAYTRKKNLESEWKRLLIHNPDRIIQDKPIRRGEKYV